jgi:hypothetical protein
MSDHRLGRPPAHADSQQPANALAAIAAGHDQAAHGNIQTAITAMQTGSADMAKATVDVNRYGAKRTGSRA